MSDKKLQIRNSTADFLVFTKQAGEDGIEVRVFDETVWLTQKGMAQLFDCSTDNIGLHLKNIFKSGELDEKSVTEESSATAADGKTYRMKFYNLDAIISVGYRINSVRATQFRQWATKVLKFIFRKGRFRTGSVAVSCHTFIISNQTPYRFFKRESKKTVYRVFFDKDLLYSFGVMPSCFLKNKVK